LRGNLNEKKTELLSINDAPIPDFLTQKETLKVTGIIHSTQRNQSIAERENYGNPIAKMRTTLNLWRMRHLSLMGRVQVIKAQALNLIKYIMNINPVPIWVTKEINSLVQTNSYGGAQEH